jgi:hypothetical protein
MHNGISLCLCKEQELLWMLLCILTKLEERKKAKAIPLIADTE